MKHTRPKLVTGEETMIFENPEKEKCIGVISPWLYQKPKIKKLVFVKSVLQIK
jgi:hypothetical protein